MANANDPVWPIRTYTIAKCVALVGLSLGALLLLGPIVSPVLGQWLSSIGAISGVAAEQMAWGPIAMFGTLVPGGIALVVGLISLVIAVVLKVRARFVIRRPDAT